MSPRLIIALALAAIVALGAGVSWILIQPRAVAQSGVGAGASATHPVSDADRRKYREKFFSIDPERDVRGGQEMKPRW
ncbi:entry exclusion protein TrbK [Rhizobium cremeum]|uniref:entry exclusion protein TrbK n=1 Tax=Rhizobium/Agrobacterium group TaxID=227290 RepID=UPI000DD70A12|nr:entry exclusion protein TrbK [Agrobacterium sp. ST15.13.015]MCJ7997566.1 entry exclusion protein TrbK [Rhizobium cremeum]MCJ8002596.1 entry exclusion protein TrbK [Rhizobium cremeum]MCZ7497406.1 entry exclusion protein TrbK [Rhizobium rhizogenes]MCZ7501899.1 entry exclusion protein TrbK [Rhizobium rhizogenes]